MVAVAAIGSGIIGAGATMIGANTAADAQTQAAADASATQMSMFDKMQGNLQPYMDLGGAGINQLTAQMGNLTGQPALPQGGRIQLPTAPGPMDEATLRATPGYQFNQTQGLKAVANSASARGLGVSGAAMKGAAAYGTGLADSTYQNQFNNQQTMFGNQESIFGNKATDFANQQTLYGDTVTNATNTYNRLMGIVGQGQSSAAGVGNAGVTTGASIGSNTIGAGNAQAAASMAGANSITSGANGVLNAYTMNNLLKQMSGGGTMGAGN